MLNKITILIFLMLGIISSHSATTDFQSKFEQGNAAYENQNYDSAFSIYSEIEANNYYSVELFQNMGTAAYKNTDFPSAILYFEKGLKLDPGNKDLQHNLKLANKHIADKIEHKSNFGFGNWISNTVGGTADFWATMAVLFSILGGVFISLRFFKKLNKIHLFGRGIGIVFWVVAIVFTIFAFTIGSSLEKDNFAIVFEPTVEVRNEPSEVSSAAFVLHEGSKVEVLESNELWSKISFGENKVGWVLNSYLKSI